MTHEHRPAAPDDDLDVPGPGLLPQDAVIRRGPHRDQPGLAGGAVGIQENAMPAVHRRRRRSRPRRHEDVWAINVLHIDSGR
ncbi:MAG: hypothetical protein WCB85_04490 [Candidatus Dormiibacterota bacterium]